MSAMKAQRDAFVEENAVKTSDEEVKERMDIIDAYLAAADEWLAARPKKRRVFTT